jgi:hypothetical protein
MQEQEMIPRRYCMDYVRLEVWFDDLMLFLSVFT